MTEKFSAGTETRFSWVAIITAFLRTFSRLKLSAPAFFHFPIPHLDDKDFIEVLLINVRNLNLQ